MAKPKSKKLHKNIQVAYQHLLTRGGLLCRQFSNSEDAVQHGGNFIYFTVRDNLPFPTGAGRFLIENNLCRPGGGWPFRRHASDVRSRAPRRLRSLQGSV